MSTDQRLIEDYIPIEAISAEARREKSVRKGHISTLHLWWARRPLVAARAAVYGALVPATVGKQKDKDTTSSFEAPTPLSATGTGGGPQPPVVTPTPETNGIATGGTTPSGGGTGASRPTSVRLPLRMTRGQLYASFNAIGNLAQEAGSIRMTVEAEKADGFDPAWLRNAVVEPLEEADVVVEG